MPITGTVRFSDRKRVTRDLVAGTTVAALLVPQAMAYAELAGLPAVTGLYASLVPLVIYAFVGTSRQMAIGPTATVAVLSATIIGPLAKGNETQALALSATLALLVGAICMLGGVLRAGFVVNFLSQPVLSGYVTGAALVIAASQLGKVLGYSVSGDTFFQIVRDALRNINQTNLWTLGVACASVAVMVALQRLTPKLPAALIVVILAIVVTTVFDLAAEGVKITGVVPGGLPSFKFPNVGLNDIGRLLTDAAGLALVAYVESIAVSKAVAARRGYPIDANRELIAVGAANVGSGLFQGFTIDGSFSRTAMADGGRATTQLAGLTTAVVVGITLLFLTPLFKNLPAATLGAVVIVAVSGLLDTAGLRRAWRIRREDFVMGLVALIGVLTFGVLEGLLIAVGTSLIALLYHAASPHRAVLGYMPDDDSFHDVERFPDLTSSPGGVVVYRFDAPLFFANCRRLRDDVMALVVEPTEPVRAVIIDAGAITSLDVTGAGVISELIQQLQSKGIRLLFARTRGSVRDVMAASGILDTLGPQNLVATVHAGIASVL